MNYFELNAPDLRSERVYSNLGPYNKYHINVLFIRSVLTYFKFDLYGSRFVTVLLGLGILALIYSCYYTILYQRYHSRCSLRPALSTMPHSWPACHRRMTRRWSSWLDLWWHSQTLGTLSCLLLLRLDRHLNWQLGCQDRPHHQPRLARGLWNSLGWK